MSDTFPFPNGLRSIRIPKNQARLLDQKGVWSNNLESGGKTAELPTEVLKQLADFHPSKKEREANMVKEHETTPTRNTNRAAPFSSPERFPSSWHISPASRARPPLPSVELPSSPLNHKTSHVASQHGLDQDGDDDSDDLEVLTPNVADETTEGVNLTAVRYQQLHTVTTTSPSASALTHPPCGQGDPPQTSSNSVPGTHDSLADAPARESTASRGVHQEVPGRRGRRMKAPAELLSSSPGLVTRYTRSSLAAPISLPTRKWLLDSSSDPSSAGASQTIPSSTDAGAQTSQKRPTSQAAPPDGPLCKKPRQSREYDGEPVPPTQYGESYANSSTESVLQEENQDLKPYDLYKSKYTYKGTLADFVSTCVCLEYLEGQDLLSDYLYDDFIRFFIDDYIEYVRLLGGREALPAYRWYNRTGGPPVCQGMVITRKTLRDVFEAYPEENREARADDAHAEPIQLVVDQVDQVREESMVVEADPVSKAVQTSQDMARSTGVQTDQGRTRSTGVQVGQQVMATAFSVFGSASKARVRGSRMSFTSQQGSTPSKLQLQTARPDSSPATRSRPKTSRPSHHPSGDDEQESPDTVVRTRRPPLARRTEYLDEDSESDLDTVPKPTRSETGKHARPPPTSERSADTTTSRRSTSTHMAVAPFNSVDSPPYEEQTRKSLSARSSRTDRPPPPTERESAARALSAGRRSASTSVSPRSALTEAASTRQPSSKRPAATRGRDIYSPRKSLSKTSVPPRSGGSTPDAVRSGRVGKKPATGAGKPADMQPSSSGGGARAPKKTRAELLRAHILRKLKEEEGIKRDKAAGRAGKK